MHGPDRSFFRHLNHTLHLTHAKQRAGNSVVALTIQFDDVFAHVVLLPFNLFALSVSYMYLTPPPTTLQDCVFASSSS